MHVCLYSDGSPEVSGEEMKNSGVAGYSCTYRKLHDCENIIL